MNYFPIREQVQLPHQVLLSSHSLLSRETPSLERSILSNECLAFGSVIEGVPNCLLWVSYEDTFLRFGFELYHDETFSDKHRNPKLSGISGSSSTYGDGAPSRFGGGRRPHEERIEARHAGGLLPSF